MNLPFYNNAGDRTWVLEPEILANSSWTTLIYSKTEYLFCLWVLDLEFELGPEKPELKPGPELASESELEPKPEFESESEFKLEFDPELKLESEPEFKLKFEFELDFDPELVSDTDIEPVYKN